MKEKSKSLFKKIFLIANYLFAGALVIAFCAHWINPDVFWIPALFGLLFPVFFIINAGFLIFWLFIEQKRIFISGVAMVFSMTFGSKFLKLSNVVTEYPKHESIKIMSYNTKVLGMFSWKYGPVYAEDILNFVKDEDPDIACFQEYYRLRWKNKEYKYPGFIKFNAFEDKHYTHFDFTSPKPTGYSVAIFSKFPIINKGEIEFNEAPNNLCIYADVKIKEDTFRIYNMHLASIKFGNEQYKFINDLSENKETEFIEGSEKIIALLKKGFVKRARQVLKVCEHIKQSPFKVIVCGDFNDTPASFAYHQIIKSRMLKDAFEVSGNGLGITYNGKLPMLRIDYILHDKSLKSFNFKTHHQVKFSDHFPITTIIENK